MWKDSRLMAISKLVLKHTDPHAAMRKVLAHPVLTLTFAQSAPRAVAPSSRGHDWKWYSTNTQIKAPDTRNTNSGPRRYQLVFSRLVSSFLLLQDQDSHQNSDVRLHGPQASLPRQKGVVRRHRPLFHEIVPVASKVRERMRRLGTRPPCLLFLLLGDGFLFFFRLHIRGRLHIRHTSIRRAMSAMSAVSTSVARRVGDDRRCLKVPVHGICTGGLAFGVRPYTPSCVGLVSRRNNNVSAVLVLVLITHASATRRLQLLLVLLLLVDLII